MQKPDLISANPNNETGQEDSFGKVVELIDNLTAYQLYRLRAHVDIMLGDPQRLKTSAREAVSGCETEYYCVRVNRVVKAVVDKVNRTTVDVTNVEDGKRWRIELAAVNTGGAEEKVSPQCAGRQLSRHDLSVGQIVGFQDRDHQDRFGTIVRLNPKTVTVECEFGLKWRVGYSLLFPVFDVESSSEGSFDDDQPRQQLLLE
jgi:hypothetical protein